MSSLEISRYPSIASIAGDGLWPTPISRIELTNPKLLHFRSINQGVVMTETNYLTQTQLADRWQVAESTLERWRSEGIGPIFLSSSLNPISP